MTRITQIQALRVPWAHSPWMRPPGLDRSVSSVSSVVFRQKPWSTGPVNLETAVEEGFRARKWASHQGKEALLDEFQTSPCR
jgi:hypothetical protein